MIAAPRTGPWPMLRFECERGADHQGALPVRCGCRRDGASGSIRRLDDREADRRRIGEREGDGAVVVQADDPGDRERAADKGRRSLK